MTNVAKKLKLAQVELGLPLNNLAFGTDFKKVSTAPST